MCNKLGKKHPRYSNRNVNLRDKAGKTRRNWNGTRLITTVYGYNALIAYTDARDKADGGEQWFEGMCTRPVVATRLERVWRCQSQQRATGNRLGSEWYKKKQDHFRRNHVRINKA